MVAFVRRLVEKATKSLVYTRRFPAEFHRAPILVSSTSGLKYLLKPLATADPALLRNARELVRPGDTVWDIGANLGLFAIPAAALSGPSGRVIAFEPDVECARLLVRSCSRLPQQCAPIIPICAAVASEVALRDFTIGLHHRATNSLSEHSTLGSKTTITVPTFGVDWLLDHLPHPAVLKCDVEGAEVELFGGAKRMLDEVRPRIICEVSEPNEARMTTLFREHRYIMHDGDESLSNDSVISTATWNTIAIPQESPVAGLPE